MTHFAVTVCLPGTLTEDELDAGLGATLARYDIEREVEPYIEYTREELIALGRRSSAWGGPPERAIWTDEQVYDHWIKQYDTDEIGPGGEVYTTSNPEGQWDYWSIGGIFNPFWKVRGTPESGPLPTDTAQLRDIIRESLTSTYAVIDLDGEWHQRRGGQWNAVADPAEVEEWRQTYEHIIDMLPADSWLVQIDCHR
ncbi:hypothetical protein [Nocardia sp. NPDC020380]|uniref:hypothetical protein n=1 Tax=Nocardia sp. NPDC020380 TaxID=3364309 RepID=UPI0037B9076D